MTGPVDITSKPDGGVEVTPSNAPEETKTTERTTETETVEETVKEPAED